MQEVKLVNMLLQEISEFQKPEIVNEENQGDNFLEKNRQGGILTKKIEICHHFIRGIFEEKDMGIKYVRSE